MITVKQLKQIAPTGRADLLQAIEVNSPVLFPAYGLTTKSRICHFLAQIAHESDGFKTVVEYASGAAYEGRKDLGNTKKGDGVRYKGRGYIQLTGRANYTKYGLALGLDLVGNPQLAEIPINALKIALEYWKQKKLNQYADKDDINTITTRINGGFNGLSDRQRYLTKAKQVIQVDVQPVIETAAVQPILATLGASSVEQYQEKKGLVVDGVVGPATADQIERDLNKPSTLDVLKSPEVIAPVAVTAGSSLVGALSASLILQIVAAVIILSVFAYFAYKKLKED